MCKACVIGLGSPQGNDAVGLRVVEGLLPSLPSSVRAVTLIEPTRLVPLLGQYARVWIVDACRSEQQVGTITRFVWPDERIDRCWTLSGHGVGLAEVLELAKTLGSIPRETVVYTIDVGREPSMPNDQFTPDITAAVDVLRERLTCEVLSGQYVPSSTSAEAPLVSKILNRNR